MAMKSKLTAIVISSLTLTATASDHHDEKKGKKKPVAEKTGGKRKLPPHMAKFDKNKDGKLCDAEKAAAKAAGVKQFDKDGNGKIEGTELAEAKKAMAERRKRTQKQKGKGKLPKGAKGKKKPESKKK